MTKAYCAEKIFTGHQWLTNHCVLTNNGVVTAVVPTVEIPESMETIYFGANSLVPAFIDIQVYGAGGKLLSMHPYPYALERLYSHCFSGGAHFCQPTVATNTTKVFYNCIDAVGQYWQQGGKGILGLHIEGPWINETKRGAHIKELIYTPTLEQVTNLLQYGKGVIKMITLAPEVCSSEVVSLIQSSGIIVSAGHSNATYLQASTAFNEGIGVATHLFNAMSPLQHRQPGMVGAIMYHSTIMSSIIPDGYHVDFEVIAIAKKVMGERLFIITDAVTETPNGPYPHQREGDKFVSNGILSGSAITMIDGVRNCVNKIGIPLHEALRMASLYPAKAIGVNDRLGKIKEGYDTEWLILNNDLDIVEHVTATS